MNMIIQQPTLREQKLSTYSKIIIPEEVENKIRHLCKRINKVEWSGVLFFEYKGDIKNKIEIICKDIFVQDIGSSTYTEFDMDEEVINYMVLNPELLDTQMGLIHSHNEMATFFSGTDTRTLKEFGSLKNNFVSLIVNNSGDYTARITRKLKPLSRKIKYKFNIFGEDNPQYITEYTKYDESQEEEVEYIELQIEKHSPKKETLVPELDERIEEIKIKIKKKIEEEKKKHTVKFNDNNIVYNKAECQYLWDDFRSDDKIKDLPEDIDIKNQATSLLYQMMSGSILLTSSNKYSLRQIAINLPKLFSKRFNTTRRYRDWVFSMTDYLIGNLQEDYMICAGSRNSSWEMIYEVLNTAIAILNNLPSNIYINIIKSVLKEFIYE